MYPHSLTRVFTVNLSVCNVFGFTKQLELQSQSKRGTKNIFSWPFKVVCHAEWSASKVFDFEWSNEWLWMVGWMASWMVTKNGIRFWILILISLMVSQHGIRLVAQTGIRFWKVSWTVSQHGIKTLNDQPNGYLNGPSAYHSILNGQPAWYSILMVS